MKKTQLNFVADVAAFFAFLLLLSTGVLLRYRSSLFPIPLL